eukprot:g5274.t1
MEVTDASDYLQLLLPLPDVDKAGGFDDAAVVRRLLLTFPLQYSPTLWRASLATQSQASPCRDQMAPIGVCTGPGAGVSEPAAGPTSIDMLPQLGMQRVQTWIGPIRVIGALIADSFHSLSDPRAKSGIQAISALAAHKIVQRLEGVTYYLSGDRQRTAGFIAGAQGTRRFTREQAGRKHLNYFAMLAYVVRVVQTHYLAILCLFFLSFSFLALSVTSYWTAFPVPSTAYFCNTTIQASQRAHEYLADITLLEDLVEHENPVSAFRLSISMAAASNKLFQPYICREPDHYAPYIEDWSDPIDQRNRSEDFLWSYRLALYQCQLEFLLHIDSKPRKLF